MKIVSEVPPSVTGGHRGPLNGVQPSVLSFEHIFHTYPIIIHILCLVSMKCRCLIKVSGRTKHVI